MHSVGLTWEWGRDWDLFGGRIGGYREESLSRWPHQTMDGRSESWVGQASVVPIFRYRPAGGASAWFFELGIGASLTTTIYKTERKRLSTSFNFAEHLSFGPMHQHELALDVEYLCNAGIKRPNPGEDFAQVQCSVPLVTQSGRSPRHCHFFAGRL